MGMITTDISDKFLILFIRFYFLSFCFCDVNYYYYCTYTNLLKHQFTDTLLFGGCYQNKHY